MKKLYPLLGAVLLPFFLLAQGNYKPGYVITLKGDTLKGVIDYLEWGKNPNQIKFKSDIKESKPQVYTVKTANAFVINDYEFYKRYSGKISMNGVASDELTYNVDTAYRIDTVFLKGIISGKNVTLYQYIDAKKTRYFISKTGSGPVELLYRKHLTDMEGAPAAVSVQSIYKQQLQNIAVLYQPQNNALQDEIQAATYFASDLRKAVMKINGDIENMALKHENQNSSFQFYVGGGVNYSSSYFSGNNELTIIKSASSVAPVINIGVDFFANSNVQKLIFRIDFNFSSINPVFDYNFPDKHSDHFSIKEYALVLSPEVLYNFYNGNQFKFYGVIGANFNAKLHNTIQYYSGFPNVVLGTYYVNIQPNFPFLVQSFTFSPTAKIGVILGNKIDAYLQYIAPTYFGGEEGEYTAHFTAIHFGINYLFGSKKR